VCKKLSGCLLANIGATRHDFGLRSVSFGLSEREIWSFFSLSTLSGLSSHFLHFPTRSTPKAKKQKTQPNMVPAVEGWRPSRQVDNQTFFDMSTAGLKWTISDWTLLESRPTGISTRYLRAGGAEGGVLIGQRGS
jgi:hypothetical protein